MATKKIITQWRGTPNLHPAISPYTTRRDLTGSWRYMRPRYRDLTPPCNQGCPAGNDVRRYIELALDGRYNEAFQLILETSPFPSVCGRVCYHPCETVCNRLYFDEPIAVHSIERFLGDQAQTIELPQPGKSINKKVAIIGAGPAGLSCAYQLRRMGFSVTVYEAQKHAGGMLYYGIPSYRLPKEVLEWEVARIKKLGVHIETDSFIDSQAFQEIRTDFDAVFVGLGAWGEQKLSVEGEELKGVNSGLKLLIALNAEKSVQVKPRIMIVGGGNTAIDVARSTKRMGSLPIILYRRTEKEMPAHPDEVKEARDEGIQIHFLAAPKRILGKEGTVHAVECQQMKLGEPDSSGRRKPVPIEGETFTLEVDEVYTAIGERPEIDHVSDFLETKWNRISRDADGKTSLKGIFCGGDAGINASGTVVNAIGEGKRAAYAIEAYILGKASQFRTTSPDSVDYEELNVDYFVPAPRLEPPRLALSERTDFSEVVHGLTEKSIGDEAARCFSCGVCNFCLNCQKFCPDSSIIYENESLEIDLTYCKGCGICIAECPRNAMCLEEER